MSDYNSLYCDLCGSFSKFANIDMLRVVNSSALFQSSWLGEILDPSPLPLEYSTVHLSSTELNYSKIQAVCYHLSFSSALFRHYELRFCFPLHLLHVRAGWKLCSCAEAFPAHKEGDWGTGRENKARQDWTGQSRTAFIKLKKQNKKTPTKPPTKKTPTKP